MNRQHEPTPSTTVDAKASAKNPDLLCRVCTVWNAITSSSLLTCVKVLLLLTIYAAQPCAAQETISEDPILTIKNQIVHQWIPVRSRPDFRVDLELDKQGAVLGKPNIVGLTGDPAVEVEFAIKRAAPFLMLDPLMYDRWKQVSIRISIADRDKSDDRIHAVTKKDILGLQPNMDKETAIRTFQKLGCRITSPEPGVSLCKFDNGNILLIRMTSHLNPNVVANVVYEFASGDSFMDVVNSVSTQFRIRKSFGEIWDLGKTLNMQLTPVSERQITNPPQIPRWSLLLFDWSLPEKDKAAFEASQRRQAPTPRL